MARKHGILVTALLVMLLLLSTTASAEIKLSDTDYANPDNWLHFAADAEKQVDIFAVYPTVSFSEEAADTPYLRIDSPIMREGAEGWLRENLPLLEGVGNVHAPLYRQLNGVMLEDLDSAGFESYTTATPRDDVFAAFDYFLTHINKGERPFLLFGHSQGAQLVGDVATLLLGDAQYSEHNDSHIATYAIGYSVTGDAIARNPALKFASSATDVGVILSWNTTAPSEIASGTYKQFGTWKDGALTVNPISWTADELLAHAQDNALSRVAAADGSLTEAAQSVNALVDKEHSVLVVTTVDEALYPALSPTVSKFHRYDVMFFYDSIAKNIGDRIDAYFAMESSK